MSGRKLHQIREGLDLPLAGEPALRIDDAPAAGAVAVLGADFVGLKPSLLVAEGEPVRRGQPVLHDKTIPGVRHVAPAAGMVRTIHRGARRAFLSVVIDVEEDDAARAAQMDFEYFTGASPDALSRADVQALLLESGMWTALRTRPFSRTPDPTTRPDALFVTAIDTRPHAAPIDLALGERIDDFDRGVRCLAKLASGTTYVCVGADSALRGPDAAAVETVFFSGPHPAGNVGTHIHFLHPVGLTRSVWHVGWRDVVAMGRLFAEGRLDVERTISLAGPGVRAPRLLRTRLGASLDDLTQGELAPGSQRVISGSVLDGRTAQGAAEGYLGRFHGQVSATPEATERELFGWIRPGGEKFSIWGVVANAFRKDVKVALNTSTNGGHRAMVPIGSFERVMPLDIMPTFLLRALLMNDAVRAEALGALELDEEDLALCTFVCPGKEEYGPLLRSMLARLEKEAA